ncbi:DUF3429 domain-containing protein [Aliidiomarina soli]|uniref:DUF3429 domain-containing protein n=1 Tax=Aliidiomarina soli TaxID=1928574 RepID=A0A432WD39_9GAMM|nr:DUF3429 domain-containing protein [Aliidiomarina soli]RUO30313.1 DUF3429 domain-containing protein [Aliidiomarina soli]
MNDVTQQTAIRLAWTGLAPFILLAALGVVGIYQGLALQAFLAYSAVILSFLGGIHWGLIMAGEMEKPQGRLLICMLPSLVGWLAVAFAPALVALVVLGLFYILWLRYDVEAVTQDWYQKMRRPITFVVTGTHFLWFIAIASERAVS